MSASFHPGLFCSWCCIVRCPYFRFGLWLLGFGLLYIYVPEDSKEPYQRGVFWPGSVQQVMHTGMMVCAIVVHWHFGCLQRAQSSLVFPGADGDRWAGANGDSLQSHNGHPEAQQSEQRNQVLRQQQVRSAESFSCVFLFWWTQPDVCVSSAIKGVELECVYPKDPSQASAYDTRRTLRHVIFTAETHNFPTGRDNTNICCLVCFLWRV